MATPQTRRVRLCLKDLYQQDVVEMIERETRKYELWSVESPDDPQFKQSYDLLWSVFGESGEMEREEVLREALARDAYAPLPSGTFVRYFMILARDKHGNVCGARDGSILINRDYSPDLCVIYLSHIYMVPEARGSVLTYWLRIAPVEIAVQYMADLQALGKLQLPLPNAPGKAYGMRLDLTAEMEYFSPEDRLSLQRLLFYGRGGFDAINPRHFPYRQPDFRDPEVIKETGNHPMPFMILVRRMGRERQATLPIQEARAIMRLLYDDFSDHCKPNFLENSLQIVLDRLTERAKTKQTVELLPLPTKSKELGRLKRLFRYSVFKRYYKDEPAGREYVEEMRKRLAENPNWFDEELVKLAADLDARGAAFVYGTRDKDFTWDGLPIVEQTDLPPGEVETGVFEDPLASTPYLGPLVSDVPTSLFDTGGSSVPPSMRGEPKAEPPPAGAVEEAPPPKAAD